MSARITDIITTGPVHYRHHYMTTMTGEEIAEHGLGVRMSQLEAWSAAAPQHQRHPQ